MSSSNNDRRSVAENRQRRRPDGHPQQEWLQQLSERTDPSGNLISETNPQDVYWSAGAAIAGGASMIALAMALLAPSETSSAHGDHSPPEQIFDPPADQKQTLPEQRSNLEPRANARADSAPPPTSVSYQHGDGLLTNQSTRFSAPGRATSALPTSIDANPSLTTTGSNPDQTTNPSVDRTDNSLLFVPSQYILDAEGNVYLEEYEYVPV